MYAVDADVMDHTKREIIMFDRLVTVTLKFCQIPERRMQFCGGDTRKIFGPLFDTIEDAQAYIALSQQMDALSQELAVLKEQASTHTIQPRIMAKYRSTKPDAGNTRAVLEWRRKGRIEVLTEIIV